IILLLAPGILAIAVSNIVGHYFAGINSLRILNIKSAIGLIFTLVTSWLVIPKWGLLGACVVTTLSYLLSSMVLFYRFYEITEFRMSDFILSKSELTVLITKIRGKAS